MDPDWLTLSQLRNDEEGGRRWNVSPQASEHVLAEHPGKGMLELGGASTEGRASPQPITEQQNPPTPPPHSLPCIFLPGLLRNAWPAGKFAYFPALMKTMS